MAGAARGSRIISSAARGVKEVGQHWRRVISASVFHHTDICEGVVDCKTNGRQGRDVPTVANFSTRGSI